MIQTDSRLVKRAEIVQGDSPTLRARVVQDGGSQILVAAISSIAYRVWDTTGVSEIGGLDEDGNAAPEMTSGATSLTPATVWLDTYSTADPWPDKVSGCNFVAQLDRALFEAEAAGPSQFLIEVWMTPTSGQAVRVGHWLLDVVDNLSRP